MSNFLKRYATEVDAEIGGRENRPRCTECGNIPCHLPTTNCVTGYRYTCKRRACPAYGKTVAGIGHPTGERNAAFGQPPERNSQWVGDLVSYRANHTRIVKARGQAQGCVDCDYTGKSQWSYDHLDPDEIQSDKGAYSLKIHEHYVPRCVPCHLTFDKTHRNEAKPQSASSTSEHSAS